MKSVYSTLLIVVLSAAICPNLFASDGAKNEPFTVNLWPDGFLGDKAGSKDVLATSKEGNVTWVTHVDNPSITIYKTNKASAPTPAIVVCPGGGYRALAFNTEGTEIAEWLNSIGITVVLLKYRVPKNRTGAFQDAQRAMRITRYHAKQWGIDPDHIGMMGFSAGGHLAARVSTGFQEKIYDPVDSADPLSCRPDFTVLIYPAYLSQKNFEIADEIKVTQQTPPAFILQTQQDKDYRDSSIAYYIAMTKASVPAELHLFEKGKHGFSLRLKDRPVSIWPKLCEAWIKSTHMTKQTPIEANVKKDK